ncbi:hypothetical protein JFP56_001464 [Salmonella enterica subsp. enterica]|nr:hypothetical protein [Salmonella enterica subsp. enterica]
MQRLSLLARGTRYRWRNAELLVRFIPAGAGNTPDNPVEVDVCTVYPRWRGEHPSGLRQTDFASRFIPAGAGNTVSSSCGISIIPVYPRWRGEHFCYSLCID